MAVQGGIVDPTAGYEGLGSAEAAARLRDEGPNELPSAAPRSLLRQAADVLREPMLLLLVGAALVNLVLAERLDGIILGSFVSVVIVISIVQTHKTERALVALRDLSAPRALVIRDGARVRVAGAEVVRGDHVVLVEGDRVPADGVLLEASNCLVDESALTGESVSVRKRAEAGAAESPMGQPGGEDTPWLFSGTLVVRGQGLLLVRATGPRTALGRIGTALGSITVERTLLQREVDRIVRVVAITGVLAASVVVLVYGLTRGHWLQGLLAGIATAMAMLPEEFPVVLTVFLALGAWRMAQQHVLTRRAPAIEALGSATVVCVDKTGTLTWNRMTVQDLILDGREHALTDGPPPAAFDELVETAVLASPVNPFDPMDRAFLALGADHPEAARLLHPSWALVHEYPLSERRMALAHVWRDPAGGDLVVAAKGAPEAIAELCGLDDISRARLTAQVEGATANGRRVLAVAVARHDPALPLPDDPAALPFRYLGLVGLHDPVRPGVAASVAECARAGVRTIMITGDYPGTARAIAREIGLTDPETCITGPELAAMPDEVLRERVRVTSVFARMVPEQKLRLVRALQDDGQVVAMSGDGVNDAPALRAADIGLAMGARGTDVAREAAALVITDDDFSSIAAGIRQGRGIFDNLRKAMTYIMAVHVPIFGMALIPVFVADWPLVLLPLQIALLELIIDPACSIVFESEAVDPDIMRRPPRRVDAPMLDRRLLIVALLQGASVLVAVLAVFLWGVLGGRPDTVVRSLAFVTLVIGNVALILVNRSHRLSAWRAARERANRTVPWILGGALLMLALLLGVPWLRNAFRLGPLGATDVVVAAGAGVLGVAWFEWWKRWQRVNGDGVGDGAGPAA